MPDKQEAIFYAAGQDLDAIKRLPGLQMFLKKDIEVLMLADSLDEQCIEKLTDHDGKKFVSIQKQDVKLHESEAEKKRFGKMEEYYKPLIDWWKDLLKKTSQKKTGTSVQGVTISKRLTVSPCTVVTS